MKYARAAATGPCRPVPRNAFWATKDPRCLMAVLLDRHLGAGILELLLHRLDVGLGHAFLDQGGRTLDQVLGFLQAQTRELTDDLDDADLLVRRVFRQRDGELGLLLDGGSRRCTGGGSDSGHGGGSGHTELLLEV